MDAELVVLRLLHIIPGVVWVGGAIFLAVILEPNLRALGPAVQGPVMRKLAPVLVRYMSIASFITIAAGIVLAFRVRSPSFWFDTGWGYAILIGLIVSILGAATGGMTGAAAKKMENMAVAMEGRPPTPEEMAEMKETSEKLARLGRMTAVLVTIGVGTMAAARFV
ncbi:MAG: hypothetical protein O2854_02905 [Chloroflexi bacterium]|nr:hypothetical protein [Chloroflexota bacterium]